MKLLKQLNLVLILILFTNCVQEVQPKIITVKVDMKGVENPFKVGIRGNSPLSWNETTFLEDTNNDGIYEETFSIYTASQNVEFKFVNNDTEFELQAKKNRSLTFEFKPETIIYEAVFNNLEAVKITRE